MIARFSDLSNTTLQWRAAAGAGPCVVVVVVVVIATHLGHVRAVVDDEVVRPEGDRAREVGGVRRIAAQHDRRAERARAIREAVAAAAAAAVAAAAAARELPEAGGAARGCGAVEHPAAADGVVEPDDEGRRVELAPHRERRARREPKLEDRAPSLAAVAAAAARLPPGRRDDGRGQHVRVEPLVAVQRDLDVLCFGDGGGEVVRRAMRKR